MWNNGIGFGSSDQIPNSFNQDDFGPSPFAGPPLPGQQYFSQQPDMMQFEETNGEGFQPENNRFNNGTFMQNQFVNTGAQFSPQASSVPQTMAPSPRPPTQINARAAELKAQLLKIREGRARPATPSVQATYPGLVAKQPARGEGSSSLRASPQPPITIAEKHEQELNLNELISQYSESKPAAEAKMKHESNNLYNSSIQKPSTYIGVKSQGPSLGSPTSTTKSTNMGTNNGQQAENNTNGRPPSHRHTSNGSVSEGEIFEEKEATPKNPAGQTKLQEAHNGGKANTFDDAVSRKSRDERVNKSASNIRPQQNSPLQQPPPDNSKIQIQSNRDEGREDLDTRPQKRGYETHQPDYKIERKQYHEFERPSWQHRDNRDEDYRRAESIEQRRDEVINRPIREQKLPMLEDLLPLNDDLREWLEITGYHNAPYRSKILNRRRAIAALDAKRDQLLAEMEAEERGGLPIAISGQPSASTMLPPPIPNKTGGRIESMSSNVAPDTTPNSQHDRAVSNKRPYSDVHDGREEYGGWKAARTYDQAYVPQRLKGEDGLEQRRPRSSGFDTAPRSPVHRREREDSRSRYEPRGRSRERDFSPGRPAYDNRPPGQGRGFESDHLYDRDEVFERGPRSFEVRGNYKGRSYDPNFRGRGRGRGRGESRDPRDFHNSSDFKVETGFGSRIANGKPYKDPQGFDKGGRGETRYFIVKSFNEENVLKCIQDSVWTTQVQKWKYLQRSIREL